MKYIKTSKEKLLKIINFNSYEHPAILDCFNKEQHNTFLLANDLREAINILNEDGYNIIGFCNAPFPHLDWDKAIVLEAYDEDYAIYWCHVNDFLIAQWRCELTGQDLYEFCELHNIKTW